MFDRPDDSELDENQKRMNAAVESYYNDPVVMEQLRVVTEKHMWEQVRKVHEINVRLWNALDSVKEFVRSDQAAIIESILKETKIG